MKLTRTTLITRDEIRKIPELHKLIGRKQAQLRYLNEKATSVSSGLAEGERVQTSPSNSADKYIVEAADLNREIQEVQLELIELQSRTDFFIRTLPRETETQKLAIKIMRYRYLKCYTWDEIADLVGYGTRWIQQIEWDIVQDL